MNEWTRIQPPAPLIRYLPANDRGRDYVVGDLHGCRALLDRLLATVNFDPTVDRLFSVGDLVDRGPDSMGGLALLREPWFHAVRGNHEAMPLDFTWGALNYGSPLPMGARHEFTRNGGEWIYEQYDAANACLGAALLELLDRVRRLPCLLVVGAGQQRFHLVHADLYDASKPDEVARDVDLDALAQSWSGLDVTDRHPADFPYLAQRWLWSRILMGGRMQRPMPVDLPGLSPTYCGHSIAATPRRALSHSCLDTGGFLAALQAPDSADYGLTLIDAGTGSVFRG